MGVPGDMKASRAAAAASQMVDIIPDGVAWKPLGARIRQRPYSIPKGLGNVQGVVGHLARVRKEVRSGDRQAVAEIASAFYDDIGLRTENYLGFVEDPDLRDALGAASSAVVEALLRTHGRRSAADFLRTQAVIRMDDGYVWGYPVTTVTYVPGNRPARCGWAYQRLDAERIREEMIQDLMESYHRGPSDHGSARDQCAEPLHPMRYVMRAKLHGENDVNEGGEILFTAEGSSALEYGEGYGQTKTYGDETHSYRWALDSYTCEEGPTLISGSGGTAFFHAPKAIRADCSAVLSLSMYGRHGGPLLLKHAINIYNTENRRPSVKIHGPVAADVGETVTLTAKAMDPDGDRLVYAWEHRVEGRWRRIAKQGGATLQYAIPEGSRGSEIELRVIVEDQPAGSRASPLPARASHKIKVVDPKGAATADAGRYPPLGEMDLERAAKAVLGRWPTEKQKGLFSLALGTGGKPKLSRGEKLIADLIKAMTPDELVEKGDWMIVIDSSGSMTDNAEDIRRETGSVLEEVRTKMAGQSLSESRVGISSYVDNDHRVHLPLSPASEGSIRNALGKVIKRTEKEGGGVETHMDALYKVITGQAWRDEEWTYKKIIYITDEPHGDTGKPRHTEGEVFAAAKKRGIIIEPVFLSPPYDDRGIGGCFPEQSSFVFLRGGIAMPLAELIERFQRGEEIPIATLGRGGEVEYQVPDDILIHPPGDMMSVQYAGDRDATPHRLLVTGNHALLEGAQNREDAYVPVDRLGAGTRLFISGGLTAGIQGISEAGGSEGRLINIHFRSGNHNYFISSEPDFNAAVVAHNFVK